MVSRNASIPRAMELYSNRHDQDNKSMLCIAIETCLCICKIDDLDPPEETIRRICCISSFVSSVALVMPCINGNISNTPEESALTYAQEL